MGDMLFVFPFCKVSYLGRVRVIVISKLFYSVNGVLLTSHSREIINGLNSFPLTGRNMVRAVAMC